MDALTLISSIVSSLGLSAATLAWLSKTLIQNQLTKGLDANKASLQADLENKKSDLNRALEEAKAGWQSKLEENKANWQKDIEDERAGLQKTLEEAKAGWQRKLEEDKANWQGEIQKEVEVFLGEKSAEREYNLEARKRLYTAIGPLRFQLLVAVRDVAARIGNYGLGISAYDMNIKGYYGRSTLYRLLRPIAITELIERQMTYADFSVDPTGVELLRFKKAAWTAFTDGDSVLHHPNAKWNEEREHVYSGTLYKLANALIIQDEDPTVKKRPMYLHEFDSFIKDPVNSERLYPLSNILNNFEVKTKPIFWIRLVCFGYICNEYLGQAGVAIGFQKREFDLRRLLETSEDKFTRSNIDKFEEYFQSMVKMDL